jgi:hypothetical protein|tara:strand:+ start:635 stop:1186 length:552 start_codon:yes stop_codon:yes gene_type:complete
MDATNLKKILDDYGKYVVQQAKSNLTKDVNKFGGNKGGGPLYNSIEYKPTYETNYFLLDFLMEDYGPFVDKGVRGKTSTYPETAAALSQFRYGSGTGPVGGLTKGVNQWIKQKKFQWRDKKTGRFLSYESMSFLIARSIYNKGLKANMFFTKPFERGLKRLGDDLFAAFELDIENAIILGKKR